MSGGQKCRLCLACAMYRKPHLLVLDEPTNRLDYETTEALIEAIRRFEGGHILFCVSLMDFIQMLFSPFYTSTFFNYFLILIYRCIDSFT